MISQYVKKNGTKIGALAARKNESGEITIGHSKWHKLMDDYNPARGMSIAIGRSTADRGTTPALSITNHIAPFVKRAMKYYKTDKLSSSTRDMLVKCKIYV